MKTMRKNLWLVVLLPIFVGAPACGSEKDEGDGDGDGARLGDGDAPGGDGDTSGDGDGDSLDQGSLSANCAGLSVTGGESCDEPGLVCSDGTGSACVCGGFSASAGDGDDNDFGRPGNDDDDPGSGVWECFSIGSTGSGGNESMGGDSGDGDGDETGGGDGSGGDAPGGHGGASGD